MLLTSRRPSSSSSSPLTILITTFLLPLLLVTTLPSHLLHRQSSSPASIFVMSSSSTRQQQRDYYTILQISRSATLKDVKKSYRRLALEHHPDRNRGNEEASAVKFREVNEAYEVLSDEGKRRDYDDMLRRGGGGGSTTSGGGGYYAGDDDWYRSRQGTRRDPFDQFNDLFNNDPFFKEAFKTMEDSFAKTFQEGGARGQQSSNRGGSNNDAGVKKGFWGRVGEWVIDRLGIEFQMTTTVSNGGTVSHSTYQRSGNGRSGSGRSSYTAKATKTVIQDGKMFTIQSMEKDGNRIEEKYDGETLVERLINGVPERKERIAGKRDDL